jgi:hypothetical protein
MDFKSKPEPRFEISCLYLKNFSKMTKIYWDGSKLTKTPLSRLEREREREPDGLSIGVVVLLSEND